MRGLFLVRACGFVLLCLLAVLTGMQFALAYDVQTATRCKLPKCQDLSPLPASDCVTYGAGKCNLDMIMDQIYTCQPQNNWKCKVIGPPPEPQPCTGVCQDNQNVGCTVNINKCVNVPDQ